MTRASGADAAARAPAPRPAPRSRASPITVVVLWLLLALFVVYPLAMLLARVLFDHGTFTPAGIVAVLTDRHQIRAFWNSLLLALLVGIGGTVLGFLFAFTAARGRLPRWLLTRDRRGGAAAAGLAAVHDGDRDDLLVRAARPHHLRAARPQGRHRLRADEHAVLRDRSRISRSPT